MLYNQPQAAFIESCYGLWVPYWNSAVAAGGIIYGLIGIIWGFSERCNSREIILIWVKTCLVSGKYNINHYYGYVALPDVLTCLRNTSDVTVAVSLWLAVSLWCRAMAA